MPATALTRDGQLDALAGDIAALVAGANALADRFTHAAGGYPAAVYVPGRLLPERVAHLRAVLADTQARFADVTRPRRADRHQRWLRRRRRQRLTEQQLLVMNLNLARAASWLLDEHDWTTAELEQLHATTAELETVSS